MREKLIELIRESEILCDDCGEYGSSYCTEAIADHLIANGVTLNEWVSVEERLPDKDGDYLAIERVSVGRSMVSVVGFVQKGESASKVDLQGERNVWYLIDSEWGYFSIDSVTHWMPLPELPKERL